VEGSLDGNKVDSAACESIQAVTVHIRKAPLLTEHAYICCLPLSHGQRMDATFVSPVLSLNNLSKVI